MDSQEHEDSGRLIRPYSLTRGRTRPSRSDFAMTSHVVAVPSMDAAPHLEPESRAILASCAQPTSVAEVGAACGLPLGVLRILLADLLDHGLVVVHTESLRSGRSRTELLRSIIDGIREL
jgi:hypothetical protein